MSGLTSSFRDNVHNNSLRLLDSFPGEGRTFETGNPTVLSGIEGGVLAKFRGSLSRGQILNAGGDRERWTMANSTWQRGTLVTVILIAFSFGVGISLPARDKAGRPEVGDEAPDFELQTLDAKAVKLSKLVTDGPVVLVVLRGYPGYQCPVCNQQAGKFLASAKKFEAEKARLLFVYPGPADNLKKHGEEFVRGKTFPDNAYLVLDPNYEFTKSYHLRWDAPQETAYPSTFVIDRDRKIRFAKISLTHGGRASVEDVLKALRP